MKNLSIIDQAAPPRPVSDAGRTGLSDQELRPRSVETIEIAGPPQAAGTEESASRYGEAVKKLQDALDQGPGPKRDVNLELQEGNLIVEIRRHDDGVLLQRFPPENLLNHKDAAADHLGTVVDRQG